MIEMIDGMSMNTAITAPRLKFGMLPSIWLNSVIASTSYSPPTDVGMP
ncbi:hypothetical protein [Bifidobacterium miconis]|nr:hypothetical protein [Bifidobacterium miconis]